MSSDRRGHPYLHIAGGILLGIGYAYLNTKTDDWANAGAIGRTFVAFHGFVDRGIPIVAGALLGVAVHWLYLRTELARAEVRRAEELRSRLRHVERDQAVWIVAASTLHELKNPLHAIGLLIDELGDVVRSGDPKAMSDQIERVRRQMDRALVPLGALRALTRQGRPTPKMRPLGSTAEEIVTALVPVAKEQGVELRLEGDREAGLEVDAESMRIILDNLVVNALEGRPDAQRAQVVVVEIETEAAKVVVRVSDDGPGLPAGAGAAVFEPLQTEKVEGLGLGLPIARALARALGGDLTTAERKGFATSFELVLPMTKRMAEAA